jgi:hypothetical protein
VSCPPRICTWGRRRVLIARGIPRSVHAAFFPLYTCEVLYEGVEVRGGLLGRLAPTLGIPVGRGLRRSPVSIFSSFLHTVSHL